MKALIDVKPTRNDEPSASSADSEVPDFKNMEIGWDVFHPLQHPIWECFHWYGGPWVHFKYWYEYRFEYAHFRVWARLTGCLWGRHNISPVWNHKGEVLHHVCLNCSYRPRP